MISQDLELTRKSIEIIGIEYLIRKRKRKIKMLVKIQITEQEVQLIYDALAEYGKPLVNKPKKTLRRKKSCVQLRTLLNKFGPVITSNNVKL